MMRDGQRSMVLGLSRRNCDLLLQGKPIVFEGKEAGVPELDKVIIIAGESEGAIVRELEAYGFKL